MTLNNNSTSNPAAPVLWILVGALLGGGGVYALGLSRGPAVAVHVGDQRPAESVAVSAPGVVSNAFAANSATVASPALASAAAATVAAAPVPGAAPKSAPRPEGDRPALLQRQGLTAEAGGERSSAFAAAAKDAPAPAKAAQSQSAADKPAPTMVATHLTGSVHYGMAGRSELMGRGAGPVYNLKGSSGGGASAADVNNLIKQAATVVQSADAAMDAAPMDEQSKRDLKARMNGASAGITGQTQ